MSNCKFVVIHWIQKMHKHIIQTKKKEKIRWGGNVGRHKSHVRLPDFQASSALPPKKKKSLPATVLHGKMRIEKNDTMTKNMFPLLLLHIRHPSVLTPSEQYVCTQLLAH